MSEIHICQTLLPFPRRKYLHLVFACPKCDRLLVCRYKSYLTFSHRAGGYYYWDFVKKGKKK